ncbi:NAD(P)H-dependent glycerol-3-phosphate dehydrogenase [Olivibacter sp. SDN3]|uniref:NAD(P)H-dependent glycerol-3-phosphate dehydrogenase n=1 Tax=Olivibacter sp. SDN3 TaxID=2764720 RepID=UPI0016519FED|nr:NAD(P)H-dependent glycerol-3-phosphate dehydrogenase [Olivibacter sp. SDN3]QNL48334.1 NAD(P)H-dependent glycerol-3-phosphate dehydrogenase [Olivibacter sp. SDN3]
MKKISVIGGGSWATALIKIFAENKIDIAWYLRKKEYVDSLLESGRNKNYLSYLQLPMQHISASHHLDEVIQQAEILLFAVPSAYLAGVASEITPGDVVNKRIITSIKGTLNGQHVLPSSYLADRFGISMDQQAIIAGPCHAEEIAMERKTYITIASRNQKFAQELQQSINSSYLVTHTSNDPIGIEYAAIYKNIIGIACGIAKGLNYGDNFQAVIVSNAINELSQFLNSLKLDSIKIATSAYLGDLLVTAYSNFSRNRTFGEMIGRGYSVQLAKSQMSMVAEGYNAAKGIYEVAKKIRAHTPIVSTVYRILHNHISPYVEFKILESQLL